LRVKSKELSFFSFSGNLYFALKASPSFEETSFISLQSKKNFWRHLRWTRVPLLLSSNYRNNAKISFRNDSDSWISIFSRYKGKVLHGKIFKDIISSYYLPQLGAIRVPMIINQILTLHCDNTICFRGCQHLSSLQLLPDKPMAPLQILRFYKNSIGISQQSRQRPLFRHGQWTPNPAIRLKSQQKTVLVICSIRDSF